MLKKLFNLFEEHSLMGEYFEGHPDDPTILCEFYLWDVPGEDIIQQIRGILVPQKFEIHSNVLTIFKK